MCPARPFTIKKKYLQIYNFKVTAPAPKPCLQETKPYKKRTTVYGTDQMFWENRIWYRTVGTGTFLSYEILNLCFLCQTTLSGLLYGMRQDSSAAETTEHNSDADLTQTQQLSTKTYFFILKTNG